MPGATTARLVSRLIAIDWNAFMVPQTVPKRPIKGAVAPTVARKRSRLSRLTISREIVTCMTLSTRSLRPIKELEAISCDLRHSRIAAIKSTESGCCGRCPIS